MNRVLLVLISVILLTGGEDAFAARKEIYNPVLDVPDVPIPASKVLVKKAIGDQFPYSEIKEETEDSFRFMFTIRSHSADLMVHFSETSIEFEFLSCVNLDYKEKKGKKYIHKNYNIWLQDLETTITLELPYAHEYLEQQTVEDAEGAELPAAPVEGDTEVYVFRKKSMVGAMLTMSVGVNDRLVAQLKSSTYCTFKEKAGFVTVYLLQANSPIASVNLDNRPGTVYLNYDYKRGEVTEIPRSQANVLLSKYKKMPAVSKPNPVYLEMIEVATGKAAQMTPPVNALAGYNKFELKDMAWSSEIAAHEDKIVVSKQLDSKLKSKLVALLNQWELDAEDNGSEKVLVIKPTVQNLHVVSDGARLWIGAWAGGSSIGMDLALVDGESGENIAIVQVNHASSAYTDRALMDYIVEIAYQYLSINYQLSAEFLYHNH